MKVPGRGKAVVEARKLSEYLLSETHPVGSAKARFFIGFGYEPPDDERLRQGLLSVLENDVTSSESTKYGVKYEVRGHLNSPSGSKVHVVTVWIVDADSAAPRLVTAYPG